MVLRNGRFRLLACLVLVGIGFLFVSGCGDDDTSTGPEQEDPTRITMQLTAVIATVDDGHNLLGGSIEVGDTITGTYVYDSTIEDTNAAPTVGDYWHSTSPYGIFLEINDIEFETDLSDVDFLVEIANNHGTPARDNYLLRSYNNEDMAPDVAVDHISWQLDDYTATAISSIELTTSPPVLADWTSNYGITINGYLISDDTQTFYIRGHVSEIAKVQ
jgi:hypothetical protein